MTARKLIMALGLSLVSLLLIGLWLLELSPVEGGLSPPPRASAPVTDRAGSFGPAELALHPAQVSARQVPGSARAALPAPKQPSPERQQVRERVLSSLREREQKRATTASVPSPTARAASDEQVGSLVDKTGELTEEELRSLNHELMPLVWQCLEQAHERDPQLKGMLAVELRFASAEDLGSIVESVEPAPVNDLGEPELIECVRQSAFTLELPVPDRDRRGERTLTIPFGIDPKDWRPREAAAATPATSPAR